jgi:hypothetical protein
MYRYFGNLHGRVSSFFFFFYILIHFSCHAHLLLSFFFSRFFFVYLFFFLYRRSCRLFGRHDHDVNRWDKYDENERRDHHQQTSPNILRSKIKNFHLSYKIWNVERKDNHNNNRMSRVVDLVLQNFPLPLILWIDQIPHHHVSMEFVVYFLVR